MGIPSQLDNGIPDGLRKLIRVGVSVGGIGVFVGGTRVAVDVGVDVKVGSGVLVKGWHIGCGWGWSICLY